MVTKLFDQLFDYDGEPALRLSEAKVPGKLFIAGEYAILEPGQAAILIAVDQYLTCQVLAPTAEYFCRLKTDSLDQAPLQYVRTPQGVIVTKENSYWNYVLHAIQTTEEILREGGIKVQDCNFHYSTDLVSENGDKYGLGSSGAVTVATIKALLAFYQVKPKDPLVIFKLATVALIRAKSNGSFADIAAIITGGWVFYQSFDRQVLIDILDKGASALSVIARPWPLLKIMSLPPVTHLEILIGWTKSPASTDCLVGNLASRIHQNPQAYQLFLKKSAACVRAMMQAFINNNLSEIQDELANYRYLLLNLSECFHLTIETAALSHLISIAQSYQYEAKSSGAGGGDCGIAIGHEYQDQQKLLASWEKADIVPLKIAVSEKF